MNYPTIFVERGKVLLQCTLFPFQEGQPFTELIKNLAESSLNEVDAEESKLGSDALFASFSLMSISLLRSELMLALKDSLEANPSCDGIFVKYYRYDENGETRTLRFSSEEDRISSEKRFIGGFE